MAESFQEIPKNKYSKDLLKELVKSSRNDLDNGVLKNLVKLAYCDLNDKAINELLSNKNFILPHDQFENIEISARINDVKFVLRSADKLECVQKSVENYLFIYEQTMELQYFTRALQLVQKVKSVFEPILPKLEEKVLQFFVLLDSSYNRLKLVENSIFLLSETSSKILINSCLDFLRKSFDINSFNDAQKYIEALNKLGHFNNIEFRIQTALSFEKEADYFISQKEPNTYYPTILTIYTKALKVVKGINIDQEFKSRLQSKIKIEQRLYSEMLSKNGASAESHLNIPKLVQNENINDFNSGFNYLLQFPIIETKMLSTINEDRDKETLLDHFFASYVHITNKGTVSGISDQASYNLNLLRTQYRDTIISILKEIKYVMDFDQQISKDLVSAMVEKCESPFIPIDRAYFFTEGLYYGFQNNFVLASHILIPQIENSLKTLIEKNGRNTIKLTEEIQNDNTMGSILNIEENKKMLDGICDRDLLLELNSFLVDGNSTNFRNRICHGLISPFETDYYGIYLWWLALKMVKQTDKYFNCHSNL